MSDHTPAQTNASLSPDTPRNALLVWTKDLRFLTFSFIHSRIELNSLWDVVAPLAFKLKNIFAFSHRPGLLDCGWQLFDRSGASAEFARMGVPNTDWSLSDVNSDYKVACCPSPS